MVKKKGKLWSGSKDNEEPKATETVDSLGQPVIGVKTEKLSDGEIEGFDPIITDAT